MAYHFPTPGVTDDSWDPYLDGTEQIVPGNADWSIAEGEIYDMLPLASPSCELEAFCYNTQPADLTTPESLSDFSVFSGLSETLEDQRVILQPPPAGPKEKRKAQNRAAQRAFRDRKEKRVQELQGDLGKVNEEIAALRAEVASLGAHNSRLTTSLIRAKDVIAALRIVCASEKAGKLSAADVYSIGR